MVAGYACLLVLQSAMGTAGADVRSSSPDRGLEHTHRLSVASHLQEVLQAQLRNHVGPQD